jgi:hypothetical protein
MSNSKQQTAIKAQRVNGHDSYILRNVTAHGFELEHIYFPYMDWQNNTSETYVVTLTNKRCKIFEKRYADNWNGSGFRGDAKFFVEMEVGLELIKRAKAVIAEQDQDEQEFMLAALGRQIATDVEAAGLPA